MKTRMKATRICCYRSSCSGTTAVRWIDRLQAYRSHTFGWFVPAGNDKREDAMRDL